MKRLLFLLLFPAALFADEAIQTNTQTGKVKATSSGTGTVGKPFDFSEVNVTGITGGGGGSGNVNSTGTPLLDQVAVWTNNTTIKGVKTIKGGTTGQVLKKNTATDYDYAWGTPNISSVIDPIDPTKVLVFDISAFPTGTTRTLSPASIGNSKTVVPATLGLLLGTPILPAVCKGIAADGSVAFGFPDSSTQSNITSNKDNWTLAAGTGYFQRWTSDASRNVTGLNVGQTDGMTFNITNVGANPIVLRNELTSSAANRFHNSTGADITLAADQEAIAVYDSALSRWRVRPGATAAGSGTVTSITGTLPVVLTPSPLTTTGVISLNTNADFAFGTKQTLTGPQIVSNIILSMLDLRANRSDDVGGVGLGVGINFFAETSTTDNQLQGKLGTAWSDAANATRTSYMDFLLVNSAATNASKMRLFASGGLSVNSTVDPGAGYVNANTGLKIGGAILPFSGGTTGQQLTKNSNTDYDFSWAAAGSGGGGTPGGSTTQMQWNNAGAFGGVSTLTTDGTVVSQIAGTNFLLKDPGDSTKTASFNVSDVPTGTNRPIHIANSSTNTTVVPKTITTNEFFSSLANTGIITSTRPTIANLTDLSGTSKLVGSNASSNAVTEITLGTNLSMTGSTLNATGGGGSVSITATTPVVVTPTPLTGTGVVSLDVGTNFGFTFLQTITRDNPTGSSVLADLNLVRTTSGTPAAGLGSAIQFLVEDSSASNNTAGEIDAAWSDPTTGTRTSYLDFLATNSATLSSKMRLFGSGALSVGSTTDPGASGIINANSGFQVATAPLNFSHLAGTASTAQGGVKTGGTTDQLLAKNSGTDYDLKWVSPAAVSDTAYGVSWNGVTTDAGSKNALYDYLHLSDTNDDGFVDVLGGPVTLQQSTATTNAPVGLMNVTLNSSGTPVTGFGAKIKFQLEDSTTNAQDAGQFGWEWTDATHATRTSKFAVAVENNAGGTLSEVFNIYGDGGVCVNCDTAPASPGAGVVRLTSIEMGNTTDTTLTRASAGVLAVEGVSLITAASISDTAYSSAFNGLTTIAPSKNTMYDYLHLMDTDDDGKVDVLDQGTGITNTNSSGAVQTALTAPSGAIVGTTDTQTLTNKRINPRASGGCDETSSATSTPTADSCDQWDVTALAAADAFAAPTGTPVNGQRLIIRIKDNGTARGLTWNGIYRASTDLALPSTTILSKTLYLGFIYNAADSKWDLLASLNNF